MINIVKSNATIMVVFENANPKELDLLDKCQRQASGKEETAPTVGKAKYDAFWDIGKNKQSEQKQEKEPSTNYEQLDMFSEMR